MPKKTDTYIRVPVAERTASDDIRTISISQKQGIKALWARDRKLILTYLFSRTHKWDLLNSKEWVKVHHQITRKKTFKGGTVVKQFGNDLDIMLAPLDENDEFIQALEYLFQDAMQKGWDEGLQELGKDLRPIPDRLVNDIRSLALSASKIVSGSMKQNIAEELILGINLGESMDQVAGRVEELMNAPIKINVEPKYDAQGNIIRRGYTRNMPLSQWSEMVARTESAKTAMFGLQEAYKSVGVEKVRWLANPDACELCQPHDGKVYDVKEMSLVPYHPNCSCTFLPIVQKQIAGRLHSGLIIKGMEVYPDEE